jgi:hypothetical protein
LPQDIISLLNDTPSPAASTSTTPSLANKVENRLCSAKTVAEGVKAVVSWLVGAEGAKLPTRTKSTSTPAKLLNGSRKRVNTDMGDDSDEEESAEDIQEVDDRQILKAKPVVKADSEDEEEDDIDEDLDEAGWESGSISSTPARPQGPNKKSKPNAPAKPTAITSKPVKAKPKPKVKADTGPITASTFLPSLSTGFTLGSDDEDDTPFDEDAGEIPARKNRRGQRARQA